MKCDAGDIPISGGHIFVGSRSELFFSENRPYPGGWWYVTVVNEEKLDGANFYFTGYVVCADYSPEHVESP